MSVFSGVDETRTCRNCKNSFLFSVDEQRWLEEKIADPKPPSRCKECRKNKNSSTNSNNADGGRFNQSGGYNSGTNTTNSTQVHQNYAHQPSEPRENTPTIQPVVEHRNRSKDKEKRDDSYFNSSDKREKRERKQKHGRSYDDYDDNDL